VVPGPNNDPDAALDRIGAQAYSPRPLTDGERWTADALLELRRGRYRPAAWHLFVRRSLKRSAQARAARPQMVRQARCWGAVGVAGWLVTCQLARPCRNITLKRTSGLLWWLSVWQMLDWHLGMAEGGDGVPRERLSSADALSLARFWLVPLVGGMRGSRRGLPAVILIGGLTDWLDGAVARRNGRTRLGSDLDTTADFAFLGAAVASTRAAGQLSALGAWAFALRNAVGVSVALAAVFGRARRPAVRARRAGAALRVGGLALAAGGWQLGEAALVIGCLIPPRSTAPHLSPA
jgi:phosphatidylglycerophosphate synthase